MARMTTQARTRQRAPAEGAAQVARRLHDELRRGTGVALPVRLWDGTDLGDQGAGFRLVLEHPWSPRALLRTPFDLAAGEAYAEGAIDIEGDVVAAMACGARLGAARLGPAGLARLARLARRLPRPPASSHDRRAALRGPLHSRARDRRAIAFHYDLPQAFYETFLLEPAADRHLVYSCAYFADPAEPLAVAQERKLDLICRKLRLGPGTRLLDIGCGWGTLLIHAAQAYGAAGVGVTLSETQAEAGRELVGRSGVAGKVEIRLQDYRDLAERERFDAVASVGMAEHVGPAHLPEYVGVVRRVLSGGGLFLNHCMVMGDPGRVRTGREHTFANAYVFPDGGLVPLWRLASEIERGGFELVDVEQLRPQYALTLRRWIANLEATHDRAAAAASEADYRIWRAYMAGSADGFENGTFGVAQVLARVRAGGGPALPLGRRWMLPD
jgi:cyclopropane-fatty-acyl-phospholipid synthase